MKYTIKFIGLYTMINITLCACKKHKNYGDKTRKLTKPANKNNYYESEEDLIRKEYISGLDEEELKNFKKIQNKTKIETIKKLPKDFLRFENMIEYGLKREIRIFADLYEQKIDENKIKNLKEEELDFLNFLANQQKKTNLESYFLLSKNERLKILKHYKNFKIEKLNPDDIEDLEHIIVLSEIHILSEDRSLDLDRLYKLDIKLIRNKSNHALLNKKSLEILSSVDKKNQSKLINNMTLLFIIMNLKDNYKIEDINNLTENTENIELPTKEYHDIIRVRIKKGIVNTKNINAELHKLDISSKKNIKIEDLDKIHDQYFLNLSTKELINNDTIEVFEKISDENLSKKHVKKINDQSLKLIKHLINLGTNLNIEKFLILDLHELKNRYLYIDEYEKLLESGYSPDILQRVDYPLLNYHRNIREKNIKINDKSIEYLKNAHKLYNNNIFSDDSILKFFSNEELTYQFIFSLNINQLRVINQFTKDFFINFYNRDTFEKDIEWILSLDSTEQNTLEYLIEKGYGLDRFKGNEKILKEDFTDNKKNLLYNTSEILSLLYNKNIQEKNQREILVSQDIAKIFDYEEIKDLDFLKHDKIFTPERLGYLCYKKIEKSIMIWLLENIDTKKVIFYFIWRALQNNICQPEFINSLDFKNIDLIKSIFYVEKINSNKTDDKIDFYSIWYIDKLRKNILFYENSRNTDKNFTTSTLELDSKKLNKLPKDDELKQN